MKWRRQGAIPRSAELWAGRARMELTWGLSARYGCRDQALMSSEPPPKKVLHDQSSKTCTPFEGSLR
jgi:hypothetical protein